MCRILRSSASKEQSHTHTQTSRSDSISLKEEHCHLSPWWSSALNSCQVLSYTQTHKYTHTHTHTHTHTLVCLRTGQAFQRGQHVVTHTREQCCCWQSLPPHYCPCHLTHRRPAAAISVPAWQGHSGPRRTSAWFKLGSHLLFIYFLQT